MRDAVALPSEDADSPERLRNRKSRKIGRGAAASAVCLTLGVALTGACGSGSNFEVKADAGAGGAVAGTGGSPGSGGGATGSGGTGNLPGTGGATGSGGGSSGACAARATFTEAQHSVLNVTWPSGTATTGGSGQVHLWGKTVFTVSGNTLTGMVQACGTVLPPTTLSALVGGGMIHIEVPSATWDAPGAPRFEMTGTQSGWNVGSTMMTSYTATMGFTIANPSTAPWPAAYTGITMTTDPDGDMKPGLTAVPKSSGGFVLPPTSALGALGVGARADKVYLVIRNVTTSTLTRTSCNEASGQVNFMHFDNHVIGCHVSGGGECKAEEVDFIDKNRTIYAVSSATSTTKVIADGATCADVRAALPM